VNALDGKVAIVTGGAGGIGGAIVDAFRAEGASVVVADLDAPSGFSMDVTDPDGWAKLAASTLDQHGRIDVLVNNAGIVHHAALEDTELADFERVMRVNLSGTFLGVKTVAPIMRAQGNGSIINVSSVRGLSGANGLGAYVSSKFAVRGLTKVAALELGRHGIRVNSIHPGAVATAGMLGGAVADLDAIDAHFVEQPIPRIGRPADIAGMAVFLASDAAGYCTGAEFVVDGGVSAGVRRKSAPGY
jgi:3alpha(or 20beta)-hydroxysteroid dehydrogenase